MKPENKIIITILLLSPMLGELLSGSSPPLEFFTPFGFIIMVTFYGGGTLLIREARARWKLQWSIGFLAIAYGILEEGIMMQSFFNPNHYDLHALSRYGMIGGVQWPWTLGLIVYHATISTLIPLLIVESLWPNHKFTPLLKKKNILLTGIAVTIVTIVMMTIVWSLQNQEDVPYTPDAFLLIASCCVVGALVFLTYHFRSSRIKTHTVALASPFVFTIVGFLIQLCDMFPVYILVENRISAGITIFIQVIFIGCIILFIYYQFFQEQRTTHHVTSFVFGSLFFWIILTPIHEFANNMRGMFIVGIIACLLLIMWRKTILKHLYSNKIST